MGSGEGGFGAQCLQSSCGTCRCGVGGNRARSECALVVVVVVAVVLEVTVDGAVAMVVEVAAWP